MRELLPYADLMLALGLAWWAGAVGCYWLSVPTAHSMDRWVLWTITFFTLAAILIFWIGPIKIFIAGD